MCILFKMNHFHIHIDRIKRVLQYLLTFLHASHSIFLKCKKITILYLLDLLPVMYADDLSL